MESMATLGSELSRIQVQLLLQPDEDGMVPWFSYRMTLPERPLPNLEARPHITTRRLVVRPLVSSDLDALHDLRSRGETQCHSNVRGRPDTTKEQTRRSLEQLNEDDQNLNHWYFGAFLQSTGELVAEGGIPDCNLSLSGWPEADFLVKPEYWRQGYGTELFKAVMDSWWDLPREKRRQQVIPAGVPGKEPGDDVMEGVVYQWEEGNLAAEGFFTKVLENDLVFVSGTAVSCDRREGREGDIVTFKGVLAANPRPPSL